MRFQEFKFCVFLAFCPIAACHDKEEPPDVDQILSDACTVYQTCQSPPPYATVVECTTKSKMQLEEEPMEECCNARLSLYECEGMLTCTEYVALYKSPSADAKCFDEYVAYLGKCDA